MHEREIIFVLVLVLVDENNTAAHQLIQYYTWQTTGHFPISAVVVLQTVKLQ